MAILTPPLAPRFQAASFKPRANTLSFTSPENSTTQTVERIGSLWVLEVALPPIREDDPNGEIWAAFLASLDGSAGRFYAGDPFRLAPRGSAAATPGTPKVRGADQSGKSLLIDGLPISTPGYLEIGDYFAYDTPSGGRSLHKLTAAANTDVTGQVTLGFTPAITERPADNADILLSPATCVMRLIDDDQAGVTYDNPFMRISFSAIEARNIA